MKSKPGTYAVIYKCELNIDVQIGRWEKITVEPGYYVYVGSAFGPGGVKARVLRHCRYDKAVHWHIDYLRDTLIPMGAWYSHETDRLEHKWAKIFQDMKNMYAIRGFGCSDCKCYSHFFRTVTFPDFDLFKTEGTAELWSYNAD